MRNIKLIENLPFQVLPIIDITASLPRKASWESLKKEYVVKGVWDHKTWHTGFRKPEDIDTIVIHHSGPPNGTLASHAKYHAGKWGAGLAYHISIDQGQIKQCNDLLSFTYHAKGNNTYTVAIEVNRNITEDNDLTDEERNLLYAAILTVKSLLPIKYIRGHKEMPTCATACPVTSMDRIRKDIAAIEAKMAVPKPDETTPDLNEELDNTPNATMAQVYAAYARFSDLYGTANKPGPNQEEAQRKILHIAEMMVSAGILTK